MKAIFARVHRRSSASKAAVWNTWRPWAAVEVAGDFRKGVLRELKKIQAAWPGLRWGTAKGGLVLYPSDPKITSIERRLLK